MCDCDMSTAYRGQCLYDTAVRTASVLDLEELGEHFGEIQWSAKLMSAMRARLALGIPIESCLTRFIEYVAQRFDELALADSLIS